MTDAGTIALLAGTKTCSAPAVGGAAALRVRFLLDSGLVSKLAHLLRELGTASTG